MTMISAPERRWLLIAIIVALLAANLPVVLGFFTAPHETQFTGIDSTAPGDVNVYRSYLEQAYQGHVVFRDLFTGEPQQARIINPFWLVLGLIGSLFHLPALLVYFGTRVLLGAVFLWLLYKIASELFEKALTRKIAFLLAVFGTGIGAWIAPIVSAVFHGAQLEPAWPMDLWVSEGFTFLSLHHSPHFLAATILIVLSVALLARSLERSSTRDAAIAGCCMLGLFSFHPFHVLSLGTITFGFAVFGLVRNYRDGIRTIGRFLLAWFIASPAIAYQAWLILKDPFAAGRAAQNILLTTPILTTVASYGLLLVCAVFGACMLLKRHALRYQLLVVWGVCQAIAIYLPVFFNRRVTQGLNIALAFLAAVAVQHAYQRFVSKQYSMQRAIVFLVVCFLAFGMSTVWVSAQDLSFLLSSTGRQPKYFFFLPHDTAKAFSWLQRNGNNNTVVLSSPITGNFIPGWSGRRVYVGHNVETLKFKEKQDLAARFFRSDGIAEERQAFLRQNSITYVFVGPWERQIHGFNFQTEPYLQEVFSSTLVNIYRVTGST
jgi:hypothetical protein